MPHHSIPRRMRLPLPQIRGGVLAAIALAVAGCSADRSPTSGAPAAARDAWAGSAVIAGMPDFRLAQRSFFKPAAAPAGAPKVFAWYMVCCAPFDAPPERLVDQYKAEIQMAQSMDIDGFGLDIMQTQANEEYRTRVAAMFEASRRLGTGFTLFFEFDYGQPGLAERSADIVHLMTAYAGHPSYARVAGRPLVCAYNTDEMVQVDGKPSVGQSIAWWRDRVIKCLEDAGISPYFVPTTWQQIRASGGTVETSRAEVAEWKPLAQGLSMWQIQLSPIGTGLATLERQAAALHDSGMTWMTTIAQHYWCGSSQSVPGWYWDPQKPAAPGCVNGTYYEHAGGKGLDMQWQSALGKQRPEWVMLLTWNDYNESYICPIDDYRKYPNGTSKAPIGWYKPQAGLDELNRYYIQWYKTGRRPEIAVDSLFYAYRTHPQGATASADKRAPVRIGNAPIRDEICVTTALTAPAQLRVASGGTESVHDVPAGLCHTMVPFHVGPQAFALWRDGACIASGMGEPVVDAITYYDFWPTTGSIRADRRSHE